RAAVRHDQRGSLHLLIGNALYHSGDLAGAEMHYREGLKIAEKIGNKPSQASSLGNLGNVRRLRGDLKAARDYQERALTISREVRHKRGEASALGNLAAIHLDLGAIDDAERCARA